MVKKFNKKLLLLLSVIMFSLGLLLGVLSIRQILEGRSDVSLPFKIAFYAASGLVPAVVLLLSAKPLYLFLRSLNQRLKTGFTSLKSSEVAAFIFGAIIGAMVGYLCNILLALFLDIDALRVLLDIIVGFTAGYIAVYLCLGWLSKPEADEQSEELSANQSTLRFEGYLILAEAFANSKITTLIERWFSGDKFVLSSDINKLIASDDDALKNYRDLSEKGLIKTINSDPLLPQAEAAKKYSLQNGLKIVLPDKSNVKDYADSNNILFLDEL